MTDTVVLSRRKRRLARLITDAKKIFELTGQWSSNPIPRCSLCHGVTVALYRNYPPGEKPRQKEAARKCEDCDIIFPLMKKTVVIETYDY